ncbi:hypothetical protein AMTRI_Chr02g212470 [Amborella trichopoda]
MNVSWNPHLELFNFNEADMNVSRNPHLELFNSNEATVFSRYNSSPQNFVKVDDFFNFNEASSDSTNSKYNSDELFNFNEASRDSTKKISDDITNHKWLSCFIEDVYFRSSESLAKVQASTPLKQEQVTSSMLDKRVEIWRQSSTPLMQEQVTGCMLDKEVEKEQVTGSMLDKEVEKEQVTGSMLDKKVEKEQVTGSMFDKEMKNWILPSTPLRQKQVRGSMLDKKVETWSSDNEPTSVLDAKFSDDSPSHENTSSEMEIWRADNEPTSVLNAKFSNDTTHENTLRDMDLEDNFSSMTDPIYSEPTHHKTLQVEDTNIITTCKFEKDFSEIPREKSLRLMSGIDSFSTVIDPNPNDIEPTSQFIVKNSESPDYKTLNLKSTDSNDAWDSNVPFPEIPDAKTLRSIAQDYRSSTMFDTPYPKRSRSRRKPRKFWHLLVPNTSKKQRQFRDRLNKLSISQIMISGESSRFVRRCMHCFTEKTPQWRKGPRGPKTLCNACGVRYMSGRLLPEYRPADSPTFVPSQHSNSHRKVIQMRQRREIYQMTTTMAKENDDCCSLDLESDFL